VGVDVVITTLGKVRVGQFFRFIPDEWYGVARLQRRSPVRNVAGWREPPRMVCDVWFDADVVNPPGIIYGANSATKVRIVSPVKIGRSAREKSGPGFIFS